MTLSCITRYKKDIMDVNELYVTANLAKLALSEAEAAKLAVEVSRMLEYFSSMSEVDTAGLEPTNYVLQKENRVRRDTSSGEDLPGESTEFRVNGPDFSDKILENAPRKDERFIIIPNVL